MQLPQDSLIKDTSESAATKMSQKQDIEDSIENVDVDKTNEGSPSAPISVVQTNSSRFPGYSYRVTSAGDRFVVFTAPDGFEYIAPGTWMINQHEELTAAPMYISSRVTSSNPFMYFRREPLADQLVKQRAKVAGTYSPTAAAGASTSSPEDWTGSQASQESGIEDPDTPNTNEGSQSQPAFDFSQFVDGIPMFGHPDPRDHCRVYGVDGDVLVDMDDQGGHAPYGLDSGYAGSPTLMQHQANPNDFH